ncbi:hypothetical protein BASA50_003016 [Batrachochytrium salamandrivorans]|uniref:Nicotinamide riboside kinase n=1 Tax=Batrachochytrium salamandrivorans TaxID=1357716 RepID=A0ABQ8FMN5_9FUNG|nr:hypothetical protein BASA62_009001 [Batrachochytrium salamandrivorans]KAH6570374.1 hypothetical protein BASA60_007763 [Batrachochytrium salamandrivorans]KAH6594502.1 hypothetical protein BASA61_003994 [Batrachochytrium salamandrivorans]KAH6599505.1 hypothetical protein BASA50_003016 [Batrachochytrium salamandrivorans]KAH9267766.1 hypothetical protein BASA84_000549 [Batrachochytrium salamandrivorans]
MSKLSCLTQPTLPLSSSRLPDCTFANKGASCSGKSTLTNWLADVTDGKVIHQDQFYKADGDIPMVDGVADWDCVGAINMPKFIHTLQQAKTTKGFKSVLGSNRPALDNSEVSSTLLRQLRIQAKKAMTIARCSLVFVDGFLLFSDPDAFSEFDSGFFLKASFNTLLQRRNARDPYVTTEGLWEDPPGYFEDIVWPAYLANNSKVLDGTIAQLNPKFAAALTVVDTDSFTIETNLSKSVDVLCEMLAKRVLE